MRKMTGKHVLFAIVGSIVAIVLTFAILMNQDPKDFYEVVYTNHNASIENYYLVLHVTDTSKEHYEEYARDVEEELSYAAKNLFIYKDTVSMRIDLEVKNKKNLWQQQVNDGVLTENKRKKLVDSIDKECYVKRADGLMMILDNTLNSTSKILISWYPLRDYKYDELKKLQKKK